MNEILQVVSAPVETSLLLDFWQQYESLLHKNSRVRRTKAAEVASRNKNIFVKKHCSRNTGGKNNDI
jgi:hypothetical protein